ncbi:MAG: DUF1080 domain-containing protein [Algoriphagus sp.]|uniref:3-keto-disaccharide hydrolase n=1 Tax=Algoriphagus sp. TaxID=1872435 RepID=UPI002731714C|nr:DUF1080 domain-containing protein [Algoriphagus sp.]MDP2042141.1 DUF1080 domain-containing protein [Algoriphagus sp.]MDP3470295.1 DUF1080 domain-containing protein [Algoriphagus sp.]
MKAIKIKLILASLVSLSIWSCQSKPTETESLQDNQLSNAEKEAGWKLLFDGSTLEGWHVYNQGKAESAWEAVNGELRCNPDKTDDPADLVTDGQYENFEFQFEWKIEEEGNSGVFINVVEKPEILTAWASGPEYQLLSNSHAEVNVPLKRSGCLYNFFTQKNPAETKSSTEWNHSKITQIDGKTQFHLNGVLTMEVDFKSQDWAEAVANSGFKQFPEFGKSTSGHISLQDWAKGISFKNLKIKEL